MAGRPTALDARYGRTRERSRRTPLVVAGLIVLVLAAAGGTLWTGLGGEATLDLETVGVVVHGERSTTVRWHVAGRGDTALVCAIEARDPSGVVVGLVEQTVPAGSGDRAGNTTVRTVRRASDGLIVSCRDA